MLAHEACWSLLRQLTRARPTLVRLALIPRMARPSPVRSSGGVEQPLLLCHPCSFAQRSRHFVSYTRRGAGDDSDQPASENVTGQMAVPPYVEVEPSSSCMVAACLHQELGLTLSEAERAVGRYPALRTQGVHIVQDGINYFTTRGVAREDLVKDLDLLALDPDTLQLVHSLVVALPGAEFPCYYPLGRVPTDKHMTVFSRLQYGGNSNTVRALSKIFKLPELVICRALSRSTQMIVSVTNLKVLSNAQLLLELGVSAADILSSMSVLASPTRKIWTRRQQCRENGLQLTPRLILMSNSRFAKMLSSQGRLSDQSADVVPLVAQRLRCTEDELLQHTMLSTFVFRRITADRLDTIASLLEEAGYTRDQVASAWPELFLRRPEPVRRRLQQCSDAGWLPPVYRLHGSRRSFERALRRWRRDMRSWDGGEALESGSEVTGGDGRDGECGTP